MILNAEWVDRAFVELLNESHAVVAAADVSSTPAFTPENIPAVVDANGATATLRSASQTLRERLEVSIALAIQLNELLQRERGSGLRENDPGVAIDLCSITGGRRLLGRRLRTGRRPRLRTWFGAGTRDRRLGFARSTTRVEVLRRRDVRQP